MPTDIAIYNAAQSAEYKKICKKLKEVISAELKKAESKVWHGSPVWFLEGNPIVGYSVRKRGVQLLFWSGGSFTDTRLKPEGSFKAAEMYFLDSKEINVAELRSWLKQAKRIQWDYKNIVKRRGVLVKIATHSQESHHRIYTTSFASVYPLYITKVERKGRTKAEVDEIIRWLTGYTQKGLDAQLEKRTDFETFFAKAPKLNPLRSLVKGVICGVRIEEIEDPLMREIRHLDKLIDELAKGRPMEKILRKE